MSRRRTVSGGYWAELKADKDLGRERVSLTIQVSIAAMSDQAERLRRGGVMHLPGALDATATDQITEAFEGSVANPGRPRTFFAGPEQFFEAGGNEQSRPRYLDLLCGTGAADMVRSSSGVAGQPLVGVWISLDALPKEYALAFVRGLHRGTLYNSAAFDPVDDTAPRFADGAMPRLPNTHAVASREEVSPKHGDDVEDASERYERLPLGAPLRRSGIRNVDPLLFAY